MNWKKLSVASVAAILLLLFLPVFYHVIFYGNNMNYNSDHKIYAIYGNKVLLALTGVGILAFMAVIYRICATCIGCLRCLLFCECGDCKMYRLLWRLGLRYGGQFCTLGI